ncbi:MAG: CBS domain-containing protein [Anaerolineae bacterium]|nr:CBS domain-containing protein [Anaerolineae bacterium]
MVTVNQMLQSKGRAVYTVGPDMTVLDALQRMADWDVGALVVVDGDDIAGIFSERDYARKIALLGRTSRETPVREIMTADVICVTAAQTAEKCMAIMTDKRIRHLPVIDAGGRLDGIISIGDVVKAIISDQRVMIDHLEDYIHG